MTNGTNGAQMEQGSSATPQQGDDENPLLGGLKKFGGLFWTADEATPPSPAQTVQVAVGASAPIVPPVYVGSSAPVDPEAVSAIERQLASLATPGLSKLRELLAQLAALDEANRFKAVQALLGGQGITREALLAEVDRVNAKLDEIGSSFERNLGQKVADAQGAAQQQADDLTGRINAINQQIAALEAQAIELEGQRDAASRGVERVRAECDTKRAGFTPALGEVGKSHASLRTLITRYWAT